MRVLTARQLAERLGKTYQTIMKAAKELKLPKGSYYNIKNRVYFLPEVVPLFKAYFKPPQGWLLLKQLLKSIEPHKRANINFWFAQVEGYKEHRKRYGSSWYYDPILIDKVNELKPKTMFVTLKKGLPKGKNWFTLEEFAALFGKNKASAELWKNTGRIPPEYIKKKSYFFIINVRAIQFIEGKVRDLKTTVNRVSDQGMPDFSQLVELDGYLLTPEQHKRRLALKRKALAALKFDN